jgi:hypothetical protein
MAVVGAATASAVLGLSGCSHSQPASGPPAAPSTTSMSPSPPAAPQTPPVPPPKALTDVLYRLADASVPGIDKLNLVENATPDDAPALDQFATALLDGGFAPTNFDATDIAWSDRDDRDVTATINVTTPNPGVRGFSFPMEFKPYRGGWQLSQRTAALLLAFDSSRASPSPAPTP